jgi:ribose transport system ATP-binding protein
LVLRDGRLVGNVKTHDVEEDRLIELMTGQRKGLTFPERDTGKKWEETEVVLSAKGLEMSKPTVLKNVDIDLRRGEIVALAGLRGQGQSDLLKCISGLISDYHGRIYLDGKEVEIRKPASAVKRSVVHISDNKEREELCLTLSVLRNFALAKLSNMPKGLVNLKEEMRNAEDFRSTFGIETPSLHQQVLNLSGGNRQKVVLSKWIRLKPKVILADQPTAGLDVGAKMDVYRILRELAKEGVSILTVLTEMEEVLNLPDRVLVMREGRIVRQFGSQELSEDELLRSYFEKQ